MSRSSKGSTVPTQGRSSIPRSQVKSTSPLDQTPNQNPTQNKDPNQKEDRVYDESEVCSRKSYVLHESNVLHGKTILWEKEDSPENKSSQELDRPRRSGIRSPLIKLNVFKGQQDGRYRQYHPNGQLKFETTFHMGAEVGPRKLWDEQGNPVHI